MKTCATNIPQNENNHHSQFTQLELFPLPKPIPPKRQISSVPGIPATTRRRYQVMVGDRTIATGLTSDEALAIAKRGEG